MPPQEILVCAKPSAARRVAGVLRSRGYAVETASDGRRAVEGAERHNPAVVLVWSDLRGPETTDVVRRVREASGAKVAVIVRRDATDRASSFLEAGADAILPDSRNLDRLARAVDLLLEGGLVTERALDLPGDEFEPEEPATNGNGKHAEDEAGPGLEVQRNQLEEPSQSGIDFQPCDVAEIVHEGAAEAARGHPSVIVQVAAPPRLPAIAHAAAIRGAVRALVEEACRGSEPGSDVTVKAQRVDAGIFVLVADRGPGPDAATDEELPPGVTLARALVALHGGILAAEPIPAGGRRVSFAIPEQPPLLQGVELQGGFRALELLEEAEAAREQELEPTSDPDDVPEDDAQLLEQAIDLAAAAADAAAMAPPPPPVGLTDPIRSLVELFGLEPEPPAVEEAELEVPGAELEEVPEVEVEEVPEAEVEEVPEAEIEEVPEAEIEEVPEVEAVEPQPEPEPEPVEEEPEPPAEEEPPAAVVTLPPPDEVPQPEPHPERVEIPEPVLAAEGSSSEPAPVPQRPVEPPKAFVPDPLHPATAILRALAEEYDDQSNRFRGR